jgi:membrane-associated protease RseP (regulator of RpoE activity)
MQFSVLRFGVLAILVGLSPSPLARAQNDDGRGERRQDANNASDKPIQLVFGFSDSQNQPAKTDQGQTSDSAQGDRQVQAEYFKALGLASQHQGQANDSALRAIDGWVKDNQGANSPGQPDAHWTWTNDRNASLWLAFPHDRSSGMSLVPADDALRSHLKLPKDRGLLVTALDPHSPAAAAGLQQNDVLLKLGDAPLGKVEDLEAGLKAAGEKPVVLHLYRDGGARKIQVLPRIQVTFGPVPAQPLTQEFWIGVSVAGVEPALRAQLRIPVNVGLLVNEVFKESPAEKAGVKVNDVLLSLNGTPLSEQKTLVALVQANGEKTLSLELFHEGTPRKNVEITPERRKLTQLSDPNKQFHTFRWDVVRPGVVLNQTNPHEFVFRDLSALSGLEDKSKDQQSKGPSAAIAKRLDDLDAEIKKLRKALEELGGASKATVELNRAIELLKKLSADKK